MTAVDPRERVIRLGNELLDAVYACALLRRYVEAKRDELIVRAADRPLTRTESLLVLELIQRSTAAEDRHTRALAEYVITREFVEQSDEAKR